LAGMLTNLLQAAQLEKNQPTTTHNLKE